MKRRSNCEIHIRATVGATEKGTKGRHQERVQAWEASSQQMSGKQEERGLPTPVEIDTNSELESELENSGEEGDGDQAESLRFCSHQLWRA